MMSLVSLIFELSQEVEEIKPDLILIDITLPYFNGFYWTTEIRKSMTLPIILSHLVMMKWILSWHLIWEEMILCQSHFL